MVFVLLVANEVAGLSQASNLIITTIENSFDDPPLHERRGFLWLL
jgi:hypothetical protein